MSRTAEQYWADWKADLRAKNWSTHAVKLFNEAPRLSAKRLGQRGIINPATPALRYAAKVFATPPTPHQGFLMWLANGASYSGLDVK